MSSDVKPIDEFLLAFRGQKVIYFPNPGNAGDSVIAAATYQAFSRCGIEFALPRAAHRGLSKQVVFYGGGGNLVGEGTYSYRVISELHKLANRLVILPHTIRRIDKLAAEFSTNVTVICRERRSYEYMKQAAPRAEIMLMDDVAFSLDVDAVPQLETFPAGAMLLFQYLTRKVLGSNAIPSYACVRNAMKVGHAGSSIWRELPSGGQLQCLRTDGERTAIDIPEGNRDLSQDFQFGVEPESAFRAVSCLIRYMTKYESIRTNRLHLAVTAALLGKEVHFLANSYYKCREVYLYSMEDRYPNVHWMG